MNRTLKVIRLNIVYSLVLSIKLPRIQIAIQTSWEKDILSIELTRLKWSYFRLMRILMQYFKALSHYLNAEILLDSEK